MTTSYSSRRQRTRPANPPTWWQHLRLPKSAKHRLPASLATIVAAAGGWQFLPWWAQVLLGLVGVVLLWLPIRLWTVLVVAAVLVGTTLAGAASQQPARHAAPPALPTAQPSPRIAITVWQEVPAGRPPGKRYQFQGTVTDRPADLAWKIYVIGRPISRQADLNQQPAARTASIEWQVSPPAVVTGDQWWVRWTDPKPLPAVRWYAVLLRNSCVPPGCYPAYGSSANELWLEAATAVAPAPPPKH